MPFQGARPRPPVAREGWGYIFGLLVLGGVFLLFSGKLWAGIFFLLAFYVAFFFRDPIRVPPDDPAAVVSPADGRVIAVEKTEDGCQMVGIFLSIMNVHINRSPAAGRIRNVEHQPGAFLAAFNKKAAEANERNTIDIQTNSGENFRVVQIAGLIARRIVCWKALNDPVDRAERLGLIQFGSRTDLHVPPGYEITVQKGESVRGGETIVARRSER